MGPLTIRKETMWSDLPEHLMERILECLPVDCFFRFRAVCKTWNTLFSSQHFNSIARNSHPFLILCPSDTQLPSLIYSFITNTWLTISLSFIPHDYPINFRGSASGLLLADINANFLFGYNSPTLCVCNPLTQTYSMLPEMVSVSRITAKTILPAGNKMEEYTVMVVGMSSTGTVLIEAYNSTSKAWKVAGTFPDVVLRSENMLFFKGYLLGMIASGGIMAYNIEQGIISIMAMPTAEANNSRARLVCCKRGVFVVRAIEENHCLKGVIVW
ncbi:F-box/kelch-repeat protein At5g15710-like [Cryptomeria japonica]|uniref:F-box/kelch-repeat protein At5g15710-like n=1 Tax=Cryptomeria japonica TaxID=3369 RepID=UPI0027DA2BF3|nr:F-box/kelch-repeat protein At5g15710-like [Cryptomeria japonica]